MKNLEPNKFFAAILVAGITASLSGFIAQKVIAAKELKENAYKIDGVASTATAAPKVELPQPILGMLATADVKKGEDLAKICSTCHNLAKGGPNAIGPNLYGVVDRPKGSHPGYSYSDAMKAKGGKWTLADLNEFLWKPRWFVQGTKMTFIGFKKAQDRADVIAYLRTLNDSPVPLPSKEDIAKEEAKLNPQPADDKKAADKEADKKADKKDGKKAAEPAKK